MGCQLGGKDTKLLTIFFLYLQPVILDQLVNTGDHVVKMAGKAAQFAFAYRLQFHGLQLTLGVLVHSLFQCSKWTEYVFS